jgi:DNA modification methylase
LIGIPWMLAFALRADGWYLRQDIIWNKPNPMPESVTDRCTKAHEYIFLLSKSADYYFDQDAIKQPVKPSVAKDKRLTNPDYKTDRPERGFPGHPQNGGGLLKRKSGNKERKAATARGCPDDGVDGNVPWEGEFANKKSVWTVSTKPFKEAHFATYPQDLISDCIKAGSPLDGLVLDPFMGGGTTALVARKLQRNYVGFEINPEYVAIAEKRLQGELGLFI